jgi:hypothetical protein
MAEADGVVVAGAALATTGVAVPLLGPGQGVLLTLGPLDR